MSLKLKSLNHIRTLRSMARECSVGDLAELLQKLRAVIEERRQEVHLVQVRDARQNEKIQRWLELMLADGIQPQDVANQYIRTDSDNFVKKRKARPAKYRFRDSRGLTKTWTGQGRMPKIMVKALQQGQSLADFLI